MKDKIEWYHKCTFAVGGLENIGYAQNQDLLIVLSTQGRGIFDCIKGEKIATQVDNINWWNDFDSKTNSIYGFDQLANINIRTCGIHGIDFLSKNSNDGWSLISVQEQDDKPFEKYSVQKIYLTSPNNQQKILVGKDGACELRAFGFSDTGKSFVIALNCQLIIYSRYLHQVFPLDT